MPEEIGTLKNIKNYPIAGFLAAGITGFILRVYAAGSLNFTQSEAAYVLGLSPENIYTPSLIQNLLNQFMAQLPSYLSLGFRLAGVLAGTAIVFLPFFLRKQMGIRAALICAFFFALDPFLIANSILITGNTLVLLTAGLLLICWFNRNTKFIPALVAVLFITGRGSTFFILVSAIFLLNTNQLNKIIKKFRSIYSGLTVNNESRRRLMFFVLGFILVFWISSTGLDVFTADSARIFSGLASKAHIENSPFLYPVALFAYIPLPLFSLVFVLINKTNIHSREFHLILVWTAIALLIIVILPSHWVIDLAWVSVPLWGICAINLAAFSSDLKNMIQENRILLIILFVSSINFLLGFISYLNQTRSGSPTLEILLSLFVIAIFSTAILVYWAYLKNIQAALRGAGILLLALLLVFQISTAFRAAGVPQKTESELFWEGYYPDRQWVDRLVKTSIGNQFGTLARVDIWVDKDILPDIYWDYDQGNAVIGISEEMPQQDYPVVFTTDSSLDTASAVYLGQKFVAEAYPRWIRAPLISLIQTEFWTWLLLRDSALYQVYNYLWLRTEFLN